MNNNLMLFCIDHEKLLEKYKTIWTKIEDPKNFNASPIYDDRYAKMKMRANGDKT